MTLNEAIREGCRLYPRQAFGSLGGEDGIGRCVIGAIKEGVHTLSACYLGDYGKMFPEIERMGLPCPECHITSNYYNDRFSTLWWLLVHLNDTHHWSREAIAEWADPRPDLHVAMPQVATPESLPTHA